MTQGEKFIAIAENEERIFLSGKKEGYADGYIEGYNAAKEEVTGYTIELILIENGRSLNGSMTLPTDNHDTDFTDVDYDDGIPVKLENVKELYVWANEDVAYISVSLNGEITYYKNDGSFEYAKANPIPITADGTYTITTDW